MPQSLYGSKGLGSEGKIDYEEAFAPVATLRIIRSVLAIAVKHNYILHQMEVETAFLNGTLKETVMECSEYFEQPTDDIIPRINK